jgi:hypothetical protein
MLRYLIILYFLVTYFTINAQNMNHKKFWKIINGSHLHLENNKKAEYIVQELIKSPSEDIINFELILRELIFECDDYKIMAIQKIIEGSVSDDTYLYFRCWLISKGEEVFKNTLKNPDSLVDIISKNSYTQFEDLLYVTTRAYLQKNNKKQEDESFPRIIAIKKGLDYDSGEHTKGIDWTYEQLPQLYPKLWALFHKK